MTQPPPPHRRPIASVVAFLLGFLALILVVCYKYLLPAARIARDINADERARKHLAAISSLVLVLVLFAVLAILIIAFRPSRWLFPRKSSPRIRTKYVDAWKESANRLEDPPRE